MTTRAGPTGRRLGLGKRLLFVAIPLLGAFLALEAVASVLAWASWWDQSFWLFEDSGRTWQFDPIRGYRLTTTSSRFLRSTDGTLEYVGNARGNAQGFADRDDFGPRRPTAGTRRFAVFGDSFTEAQFLGQNWPDRAEDLARGRGEALQLLNFAISGGGLANWWSVLTKLVGPEGYELDGVIFAVFAGDLRRTFSAWDHRVGRHPRFGRTARWDPSTYPSTFEQAQAMLVDHPGWILSPEEFERALQGQWPRSVPRRFRPYLTTKVWRLLHPAAGDEAEVPSADDPDRQRLIADIARFLAVRRLPALVIAIPDRPGLLGTGAEADPARREAEDFARAIGAAFLDGRQAFNGLGPAEIRAQFLPYDGHWNQSGSNRFAEFVGRRLGLLEPGRRGVDHPE